MLLILKFEGFGLHKIIKETKNCYWFFDNKIGRQIAVLKNKWYVKKIW